MPAMTALKLSLIDGQRRHAPPEIGERHARGGTLYVMVEVSAPTDTWDQSSREIVSKALQTFAASQAPKHAQALQAAAEAVNQLLLTQNAELLESRQVWAGFNALFIQDGQLHLAQAGPALTYLARGPSLTRFPKSFEDLKRKGDPLTPLGEQEKIRTRLARFALQPDDMLVLAASHVTTFEEESHIHEIIQRPTPDEVVEGLIVLTGQHDFTACVVQYEPSVRPALDAPPPREPAATPPLAAPPAAPVVEAAEPELEPEPEPTKAPPVPIAAPPLPPPKDAPQEAVDIDYDEEDEEAADLDSEEVDGAGEMDEEEWFEPEEEWPAAAASIDDVIEGELVSPPPVPGVKRERFVGESGRTASEREPLPPDDFEVWEEGEEEDQDAGASVPERLVATVQAVPWGEMGRRVGAALLGGLAMLIGALSGAISWWRARIAPQAERIAPGLDRVTHGMTYATQRSAHAVTDVMRSALPGDHPAPDRSYDQEPAGDGSTFMRSLALLIPLVLLVVLLGIMWQRRGSEGDLPPPAAAAETEAADFESLVDEARGLIMQASNVEPAAALDLLAQANDRLTAALPLAPNDATREEILALQAGIEERLESANFVPGLPTTTLAPLPAGADADELVVAGPELFLLDDASGTLYRLASDRTNTLEALVSTGDSLGALGTMDTMSLLTYMPATGNRATESLLVQTEAGRLYEVQGDTITQMTFWPVASEGYRATATYEDNYYVLDPTGKQVWKYVTDESGQYSANPVAWLQPDGQQQMGDPIDMAIDGTIYMLEADGRLLRFRGGLPLAEFALQGAALTRPVAVAKQPPEESDLFVAEPGRVLRFSADGRFVTEYAPPSEGAWGTIRDIAVSADGNVLFLLTTSAVQRVDLQ